MSRMIWDEAAQENEVLSKCMVGKGIGRYRTQLYEKRIGCILEIHLKIFEMRKIGYGREILKNSITIPIH